MAEDVVLLETEGAVATLTINRPQALNALNEAVIRCLHARLMEISDMPEIRAVILTGAGGKAFVAGADIAQMHDMSSLSALEFSDLGHRLGHCISTMAQPVIAAVNGFALGGGCELALACDFIYASEGARFGQPEVNLGLIPGFGGTQRLPRLVGQAMAKELVFTGRIINAAEALRIGLVNAVLPADELLAGARKTALTIASKGPRAVSAAKRTIHTGADKTMADACQLEAQAFSGMFETEDAREGMKAFVEKRPAEFKGN